MAIPYPYNRLGINTGGEIIKYEPILGSQGVFVYDSRNASVTNYVSSAMNFIGLNIGRGSGVDIWSRGYVKDLGFIDYSGACSIYSGGKAVNLTLNGYRVSIYNNGGYINSLSSFPGNNTFYFYSGASVNNIYIISSSWIYANDDVKISNATLVSRVSIIGTSNISINSLSLGQSAQVYITGGEVNNASYGANGAVIDITDGFLRNVSISNVQDWNCINLRSATFFDGSYFPWYYRSSRYGLYHELNIYDENCYLSNISAYLSDGSAEPSSKYVLIRVHANNVTISDINLAGLENYDFGGYIYTNLDIHGTNKTGSYWVSNNTYHNFSIFVNSVTVKSNATCYFDTLHVDHRLYISAPNFNANNVVIYNVDAWTDYGAIIWPTNMQSISVNGVHGDNIRFAFSNGSGSNVPFFDYQAVSINGYIYSPYMDGFYLYSGTFIKPYIESCLFLKNNASVLSYTNDIETSNDSVSLLVYPGYTSTTDTLTSDINGTTYTYYKQSYNTAYLNSINMSSGTLFIDSYGSITISNLVLGSDYNIEGFTDIFKTTSVYYGYNTRYNFYEENRILQGTHPYGYFNYSSGTYTTPYIKGSLTVRGDASIIDGYLGGTVYIQSGGYASGVTVLSGGYLSYDSYTVDFPGNIYNVIQSSGGDVFICGSSEAIANPISGINDYGAFSVLNGVLYNGAFYGSRINSFLNATYDIYGASNLHVNNKATCLFICNNDSWYGTKSIYATDITLDSVYLNSGGCLYLSQYPGQYKINMNVVYIDSGRLSLKGSAPIMDTVYPYTGVTVNSVIFLGNKNQYLNALKVPYNKDVIEHVYVESGANVYINEGSFNSVDVASGGGVIIDSTNYITNLSGYFNIQSGGYMLMDIGVSNNIDISGINERGSFVNSYNYVSNVIFNWPPNRYSLIDSSYFSGVTKTLFSCLFSNDYNIYLNNCSLVACTMVGGDVTIFEGDINYMYISEAVVSQDSANASFCYLYGGTYYLMENVTLHDISVMGGELTQHYYNDAIYGLSNVEVGSNNEQGLRGWVDLYGLYNISNLIAQNGGYLWLHNGTNWNDIRVNSGGYAIIDRGTSVSNVLVNGGGTAKISGKNIQNVTVNNLGTLTVSYCEPAGLSIMPGGSVILIGSLAKLSNVTLNGNVSLVGSASLDGCLLNSDRYIYANVGILTNCEVSGGSIIIEGYCRAERLVLNGGYIGGSKIQAASLVLNDVTANFTCGAFYSLIQNGGVLNLNLSRSDYVEYGTINNGGIIIDSGASLYQCQISGGSITLQNSGVVSSCTINNGDVIIDSMATLYQCLVSGGSMTLQNSGVVSYCTINNGGVIIDSIDRTAALYRCQVNGGSITIQNSCVMNYCTINNGGVIIDSNASLYKCLVSGGSITLQNLGAMSDGTINNGGVIIDSSAIVYRCQVNGGNITLQNSGEMSSCSIYGVTIDVNTLCELRGCIINGGTIILNNGTTYYCTLNEGTIINNGGYNSYLVSNGGVIINNSLSSSE